MEAGRIDVPLLSLRPSTSATKFAMNLVNHAHIERIALAVKVNVCTLYYCPEPCWDGGMSTATKTYSHTDKQALHVRFRYPKEALHVSFPPHRHVHTKNRICAEKLARQTNRTDTRTVCATGLAR